MRSKAHGGGSVDFGECVIPWLCSLLLMQAGHTTGIKAPWELLQDFIPLRLSIRPLDMKVPNLRLFQG